MRAARGEAGRGAHWSARARIPILQPMAGRGVPPGNGRRQGAAVRITTIADQITRGTSGAGRRLGSLMFEPVIRLGVTGLSRAGKTVFITSLVANLLDRGRMGALAAAAQGRIDAAFLQPQPDDTVPRFAYERHLAALTGPEPAWPEGTSSISELRLSLRLRPAGLLAGLPGPRVLHLDIVDYPGEWLLDLALLERGYADWSAQVLARMARRAAQIPEARAYLEACETAPATGWEEPQAEALAGAFTAYLGAARRAGFHDLGPGRFLMPGDLAGSPVLTFAPLPEAQTRAPARGSLAREFARRFEAYRAEVVRPFFRAHFARIDRQIVLVDLLAALEAGPEALEDLRLAMAETLAAFRPGTNPVLARLLRGRRVERILFAATKADHLHHTQHPALTALIEALTRDAAERARFAGARVGAMSIAALRTTVEDQITHAGAPLPLVRGRMATGRRAAFHPGDLPQDPRPLLAAARAAAAEAGPEGALAAARAAGWPEDGFSAGRFLPAPLSLRPGEGPPHIRLDQALQFLIGDRL